MVFPPLGNFDHVVVSVSIYFLSNSKRNASFYHIAYGDSCADLGGLCDHLRDLPWEGIFKLSYSAATSAFCEWVQVGISVYILHGKNPSSLTYLHGFHLFLSAAAIVHRNH